MSAIYDNWERLVGAVLKKEPLWQLFHEQSRSPSVSSDFSFSRLNSSFNDVPFSFSSPECSASNQKDDDFGTRTVAAPTPSRSILVKDHSPVDNFIMPNKNPTITTPPRKRDLKIQVPKLRIEDCGFSRAPQSSECSPDVNRDHDARQESYPLPLPAAAISNSSLSNSAANSPSAPSRRAAENVKCPAGTTWKKGKSTVEAH